MRKIFGVIVVIALFIVALLFFLKSNSSNNEHRNAFESNGLAYFLNAENMKVVLSNEITTQKANNFAFRIMPLSDFIRFNSSSATFEFSINEDIYDTKLSEMSTLVIVPKWNFSKTFEVLNTDILIPDYLINQKIKSLSYNSNTNDYIADIIRTDNIEYKEYITLSQKQIVQVSLYLPQFFSFNSIPKDCHVILKTKKGVLIYKCKEFDNDTYYLSDPDLLNNHGLSQGENAKTALALMPLLGVENNGKPIFLDTRSRVFPNKTIKRSENYDRSASDLKGFIDYPLGIIWGTIFLVAALCFWRGFYRFGLPLRHTISKIEFSKIAAVSSVARLLRLSGNDGKLVSQFIEGLLVDKAVAYYGRTANNEAGVVRLFKRYERINETEAKELKILVQMLITQSSSMNSNELNRKLEKFKELLRSMDLGTR